MSASYNVLGQSDHIGTELRAARNAKGLSVAEAASILNINPDYIAAIEDLDTGALPSLGYVMGFLRSYAKLLGMNPAEAVARYRVDSAIPEDLGRRSMPHFVPQKKIKLPKRGLAAAAIAMTFGIVAVWYSGSSDAQDEAVTIVEAVSTTTVPEAVPQLDPAILTLKARRATWVEIRNSSDEILVSRIFIPGESFEVQRESGLVLSVRDAGAISIMHMGESSGPIGPKGQPIAAYALP